MVTWRFAHLPRGIWRIWMEVRSGRWSAPLMWDGKGHLTWKNRESLDETAKMPRSQNLLPLKKKIVGLPVSYQNGVVGQPTGEKVGFLSDPQTVPKVFQHGGWPASRPSRSTDVGHLRSPHRGSRTLAGLSFFQTKVRRKGNSCRTFSAKKSGW